MVLRHDYISNVWVREQVPSYSSYTKNGQNVHIHKEVILATFCYCGFPLILDVCECSICSSTIYKTVVKTAVSGILEDILNIIK